MSLPSIIAGIVLFGILAVGFVSSLGGVSETGKTQNVKTFFVDGMSTAVSQCYVENGASFTACTKAELVRVGKIPTAKQSTEWNDTWTTGTAASNSVTIVYPLDGFTPAADRDAKGAAFVTSLNASNAPISASYDGATDKLTVVYSL